MDKINTNSNKNLIFQGMPRKKHLTDEEKNKIVLAKCLDYFLTEGKKQIPESHKFSPFGIEFQIEGTNNVGRISITYDETDYKTQRRLSYGVRHKNSDFVCSNYIFKGTKEEILKFLDNPREKENMKKTFEKLSKEITRRYSK